MTASASPRTGSSTDSACGPTSHRPPFSRRQGESAYGLELSSAKTEPSQSACAVNQPPTAAWAAIHSPSCSPKRAVKKTTEATPARSAAAATARASGTEVATGLSSSRWQPASAARTANGAWTDGGRAIATASQAANSSSGVVVRAGAVGLGQRGGGLRPAPPDAGELDAGVRGEGGGVDAARPGAGAEESDAQGRHGASVPRGAGRGADFAAAAPWAEGPAGVLRAHAVR